MLSTRIVRPAVTSQALTTSHDRSVLYGAGGGRSPYTISMAAVGEDNPGRAMRLALTAAWAADGLYGANLMRQLTERPSVINRDAAIGYVLGRRTPPGGYSFYRTPKWGVEEPNSPDTLAALESLRLLGVAAPAPELTGRWLRGLQSADGHYQTLTIGWAALRRWARPGADLETTAVAVRVTALLGLPGESEAATSEFLHRCEDAVFGLRLAPRTAATTVGALRHGLLIACALSLPLRYPDAISRSIGRLQRPSGGLGGRDGAIATLRDTWLGLHAACLLDRLEEKER